MKGFTRKGIAGAIVMSAALLFSAQSARAEGEGDSDGPNWNSQKPTKAGFGCLPCFPSNIGNSTECPCDVNDPIIIH